ncbi:undecaprenyl-phosphate glucose phosphotransferase [Bradyrhizobium sp.]|jgi:undecaprenyl-phosphate galactose phosphotransferase/putative colanic acid biosynthesis UDP-glucose lipid carrier transferase|uniref:undecaprenyl-phosphate glucose phosphotransferase n=1 Tax=Bradyrhizobium sp. TaxID=376 RepID=UPI003C130B51
MAIGSKAQDLPVSPQRTPLAFPCEAIPYLLSTIDALIILFAALLGCFAYHLISGTPIPDLSAYFALGLFASFIHIARLSAQGYFEFETAAKPSLEIAEVSVAWLGTGLLLAFFALLFKIGGTFSRGAFLIFLFAAPIVLLAERKFVKYLVRRAVARGAVGRRDVVLLGDANEVESLGPSDLLSFFGASEVHKFVLSTDEDREIRRFEDGKTFEFAANFVRSHGTKEILLALPWNDTDRIDFVRDYIKTLPVSAKLLPDKQIRTLNNYVSSAGQRIVLLEIQRAPLSTTEQSVKRTMDVAIGLLALIFLFPVMVLTALAIKLDGNGPIFFVQNRRGFSGRNFSMFKFRTMTVQENGEVITQATRNDPRVTEIGRLLRAASIDELPQLLNVIRGEMSLVGPRPHALAHDNYFERLLQDYAFRHHAKPGMTGWAQVNGLRGATPSIEQIAQRVQLDLWYINNWSLWLDIQILIKTLFEVMRNRNAF